MEVVCNSEDYLRRATNISRTDSRVAILYRGTRSDGSGLTNSIFNTGEGGEIHIESGGVARVDDGGVNSGVKAVVLSNTGSTHPLRLVTASGTSISNADTSETSDAISVSGGGDVFLEIAGSTSSRGGYAIFAEARGVDIDIAGGTHTSPTTVVFAQIDSGGTGAIDMDITGGILYGGSATEAVVALRGRQGADSLLISSGVVICRGTYSTNTCTPDASGLAVFLGKTGTQAGSVTFTNSGFIWGDISLSSLTVGSTILNRPNGNIHGIFTGGSGDDVVTNAGTWTLAQNFDFGGTADSDSFTNSGTFIVYHDNTTLSLNNLEAFTLEPTGTVTFSLGTRLPAGVLLDIGAATPRFAGTINMMSRDNMPFPHAGVITLLTGTSLASGMDLSALSLTGAYGSFSISNNNLLVTLQGPPADITCGVATARSVIRPGYANKEALCNENDNLVAGANILRQDARVAILYHGTQTDGTGAVNSIANRGPGGEIHIRSGSVFRANDGNANIADAVSLGSPSSAPLRLRLLSGTSVTNADTTPGSDAISVRGGGNVFLEIAGSTAAVGGSAISATSSDVGNVNVNISGGTHTSSGRSVLSASILQRGIGAIDVNITGTQTILNGGLPVELSGRNGADTLDIGGGVVICSGTYRHGNCVPTPGNAIFVDKNSATSGSVTITSAGSIHGDITIGRGFFEVTFINKTDDSVVTNEGDGNIEGHFRSSSSGKTELINEAVWIMSENSAFGAGLEDRFTNRAELVLKYTGDPISITGLETFVQTSDATLRIEIDARGADPHDETHDGLPTAGEVLFDVGRASGRVSGFFEVIILETLSRETVLELIAALEGGTVRSVFATGHTLDFTDTRLSQGVQHTSAGALSYDLGLIQAVPVAQQAASPDADNEVVAQATDSVVQSSWFATRAFVNSLAASECSAETTPPRRGSFFDGSCGWMNFGGRFLSHDRTTVGITKTQEDAVVISGGLQMSLGSLGGYVWNINSTAAYEFTNFDMGQNSGTGHRGLVGLVAAVGSEWMPMNFLLGITVNSGTYELSQDVDGRNYKGEPEVVAVAGHGGLEYLFSGDFGTLGSFGFVTRLQADAVGLFVEGWTQTNSGVRVGEVEEVLLSLTPSVELRTTATTALGDLHGWLEVGLVGFPIKPELEYEVAGRTFEGTMEQFFMETSVGVNLVRSGRSELSLFWDGLFGFDTLSNTIALKAKYSF